MVSMLPSTVQERVLDLLKRGDFVAAKRIHDQWILHNSKSPWVIRIEENKLPANPSNP